MNTFLYVILAIIGTIFGSFFTLAVYRIPRKENIIYVRSHCTSCNHRLEFWDLIPVLSYIFLGGKCRYCKEPIKPRYILLELLSGVVFVLLAFAMNISVTSTIIDFVIYACTALIVCVLCITMGIGRNINISVVLFGIMIRTIYLVFFDRNSFIESFFETSIFMIVSLIALAIIKNIFSKNEEILQKYSHAFGTILLFGLLIYIFGLEIAAIVILLGIIIETISRYIFKANTNYIMYICLVSIFALVLMSNSNIYEYVTTLLR